MTRTFPILTGSLTQSMVTDTQLQKKHLYTDTINDIGCEQMVDFPTRIDNTLDIFCTNRPSLVDRCIPLSGLSDHDTVLVDCKVLPARKKPIRRKIYLWRRANKPAMDQDYDRFHSRIRSQQHYFYTGGFSLEPVQRKMHPEHPHPCSFQADINSI